MIGKKIIINQILLSKLWYRGQIYTIPKYIKKKLKNKYTISSGTMKTSSFNYSMLGYIKPPTTFLPMSVEKNLDQPIFLNQHTRLDFSFDVFDNLYLYSIPTRNISDKFTIIGTLADFYNQVLSTLRHFSRNYVFLLPTIKDISTYSGLNFQLLETLT